MLSADYVVCCVLVYFIYFYYYGNTNGLINVACIYGVNQGSVTEELLHKDSFSA